MAPSTRSGIQKLADGSSFIPSSQRADGSTRKEIRVRPGYRPPEDVDTYKSRNAEAWRTRGNTGGGVPGADSKKVPSQDTTATKNKNAKRREAARNRQGAEERAEDDGEDEDAVADGISEAIGSVNLRQRPDPESSEQQSTLTKVAVDTQTGAQEAVQVERQKKIRNQLKKLKGIREIREKKASGEKLSPDQLAKLGKEGEVLRDLKKLEYDGPEMGGMDAVFKAEAKNAD